MRSFAILMAIAVVMIFVLPALVGCASPEGDDLEALIKIKQVQHTRN